MAATSGIDDGLLAFGTDSNQPVRTNATIGQAIILLFRVRLSGTWRGSGLVECGRGRRLYEILDAAADRSRECEAFGGSVELSLRR